LLPPLIEAAPIGLTELAWAFMWYFATVLLGFLFTDQSLGWFGASHRILMALHTFVWLYFFNLLPSISRCVGQPREYLQGLMSRSIRLSAWSSIFVAFGMTVLAREALTIVYGAEFAGAARSFSVLVWMLPVAMMSGHYRYALIAYDRQKTLLYCTAASAVAAVLLGLLLVPVYHESGAAWALLLANILNLVLVYFAIRRWVDHIPMLKQLGEALGAMAVATLIFYSLKWLNIWIASAISGSGYAAVMFLSQGRRVRSLVGLVRKRRPRRKAAVASKSFSSDSNGVGHESKSQVLGG